MERRKHERQELTAPVKFEWVLPDSARREGSGVTRDFSATGLFVLTGDPPPLGTSIHFEVDLATSRVSSAVTIRAKGLVNRIEKSDLEGPLVGFAVSTRRMRLEKPAPEPS